MEALGRANEVRRKRAQLKRDLKGGRAQIEEVLQPPARVPGKRDDPRPADLDAEAQAGQGQPGAAALPDLAEPDRRRADRTPAPGDHRRTGPPGLVNAGRSAARGPGRRQPAIGLRGSAAAALDEHRRRRASHLRTSPNGLRLQRRLSARRCRRCQRQAPATTAARACTRNPTRAVSRRAQPGRHPGEHRADDLPARWLHRFGAPARERDRAREARADGRIRQPRALSDVELDHIVSLGVGGAANDPEEPVSGARLSARLPHQLLPEPQGPPRGSTAPTRVRRAALAHPSAGGARQRLAGGVPTVRPVSATVTIRGRALGPHDAAER